MRLRSFARLAALCLAFSVSASTACLAQASGGGSEAPASRWDLYGGYGVLKPVNSSIGGYDYQIIDNPNATFSLARYFNYRIGLQVEGQYFSNSFNSTAGTIAHGTCTAIDCDQSLYSGEAGPIWRWPMGSVTPFVHALGGGARFNGPAYQKLAWGYGLTGGGGIDLNLPYFNNRFSIRPIQADYEYDHVNNGPLGQRLPTDPPNTYGGIGELKSVKLSAGLVVHFGDAYAKQLPIVLGCGSSPVDVYPGDIVTVTATTGGINPKSKVTPTYTWAAKGGKLTPAGSSATIDTTGLAPGQYDVMGHVAVGSKPNQQAFCSAPFNVKAFDPPTLSCSAVPSSVTPGTPVTITANGRSPQNRALTYTFNTTAGTLNVTGPNATLSTLGLPTGTTTVTCKVSDDVGNSATSTVDVTVTAPTPKPAPSIEPLCSLSFALDARRPARVDNTAKACLDEVALALNRQADAKLVMVGNAAPKEAVELAAERALNAREYLTKEKGIDTSRIELRTGTSASKSVNNLLVPAGVAFTSGTTQTFDETKIVRRGQPYPGAHPVHKKKRKPATGTK